MMIQVFSITAIQIVPVARKIEDVYANGDNKGKGVTDNEAHKKGLAFAVEGNATYFENDGFEGPGNKDGKDRALHRVEGDNGKTDGVEGPPSETILANGEDDHDQRAPQHVGDFKTVVRDVAHVADG